MRDSLHYRLLLAAAISTGLALLIVAYSLSMLFERHLEQRIGEELVTYINQLASAISLNRNGRIIIERELAEVRFSKPMSGLYWQVQDDSRPTLLRSRSLWDDSIALPDDTLAAGVVHQHRIPGPRGRALIVRERQLLLPTAQGERRIRIAAAIDAGSLTDAGKKLATDMLPYLLVTALILLSASWLQVRTGLRPLAQIQQGVAEIRTGNRRRFTRKVPQEVMPLIDEINSLLDSQEKSIERSRAWTADLAHGLKTPLSILTADAQRLRDNGQQPIAKNLEQLAETMRRRVERELIRARIRSGIDNRYESSNTAMVIRGIIQALQRSPPGEAMDWQVETADDLQVPIPTEDLAELLGNILENAAKWARTAVAVTVTTQRDMTTTILVEDDGPGVAEEQLQQLGQRGMRLDEQVPGTGLGLAIARDVCEAYGSQLSFSSSTIGGLAVTVVIPAKVEKT